MISVRNSKETQINQSRDTCSSLRLKFSFWWRHIFLQWSLRRTSISQRNAVNAHITCSQVTLETSDITMSLVSSVTWNTKVTGNVYSLGVRVIYCFRNVSKHPFSFNLQLGWKLQMFMWKEKLMFHDDIFYDVKINTFK